MKKYFLAPLLVAVAFSPLHAFAADPEVAVREGMDEILAVAEHSQGGRSMSKELQPILEKRVCFESMTRRAVGPGWKQFDAAQKEEATRLFTKLIIRSYCNKFTPGEKADIDYRKAVALSANTSEVPTVVAYKGSRYNIVYRMENRGSWLVTDILVEGVSLVANYRAQFDELFKKGGSAAVLASLKQSVSRDT